MEIIVEVCENLPKHHELETASNCTSKKFVSDLEKVGCKPLLESHTSSRADGVSNLSVLALKAI